MNVTWSFTTLIHRATAFPRTTGVVALPSSCRPTAAHAGRLYHSGSENGLMPVNSQRRGSQHRRRERRGGEHQHVPGSTASTVLSSQ
ncbi:MAG: hypothetical protein ACLTMP_10960 [Eggerthella lenta]